MKVFQTFFFRILSILSILAILLQTIAIKVLTDLFSVLRLRSIDMKVFQTFAPYKKNARAAQQPRTTQHSAAGPRGPECL